MSFLQYLMDCDQSFERLYFISENGLAVSKGVQLARGVGFEDAVTMVHSRESMVIHFHASPKGL